MNIRMLFVFDDDFFNCVELLKRIQLVTNLKKRRIFVQKCFELGKVREDLRFLSRV
jgi:hypothetical protein